MQRWVPRLGSMPGADRLRLLVAALALFGVGSGPIRGFAVTLFIGIITSVFTALFVTRLIIQVWFNWRKPKTIVV